jgi:2-oxoglutarate dehydrogenase E1 component
MNSTFSARSSEALIEENYGKWVSNPRSVDPDWAAFFEGFELGNAKSEVKGGAANGAVPPP